MKKELLLLAILIALGAFIWHTINGSGQTVNTLDFQKERMEHFKKIVEYERQMKQRDLLIASMEVQIGEYEQKEDSLIRESARLKKQADERERIVYRLGADSTTRLLTALSDSAW
jgi:hypothetical protein